MEKQTATCELCGKPVTHMTAITGNPKIYHWDCAYQAAAESRENLRKALRAMELRK